MIGQLSGKIVYKDIAHIILDVAGVGYKVHTGLADMGSEGETVTVWTHLSVREDALDLYGFETREALNFFEQLLKVSGIGPKSAMNILSVSSIEALRNAIVGEDIAYLTKISGIGRKTAEKMVIELRDKLGEAGETGTLGGESDVLEALVSLGYGRREIQDILRKSPPKSTDTGERVREVLAIIGKKNAR
jgi:Holliday junction DNA helicase RuvA